MKVSIQKIKIIFSQKLKISKNLGIFSVILIYKILVYTVLEGSTHSS